MTQTWKKIATVSLAAVMLTGSLAGCGKKAVSIDKDGFLLGGRKIGAWVSVKKTAYSTCACFSTASLDTASCHTAMLTLNNNDYVLSIANLLNNFGNIRADTFLKLKSF